MTDLQFRNARPNDLAAIVQLVELEHLLEPEVRALLFTPDTPAPKQAAPC